jgi:hypothetical protein
MTGSTRPDKYVLDTLANDVEDLESILRMLKSETDLGWRKEWGHPFTRLDVVSALSRLVRDDFVQVFALGSASSAAMPLPRGAMPPGDYDDVYFGLTERGRIAHSNWEPEAEFDGSRRLPPGFGNTHAPPLRHTACGGRRNARRSPRSAAHVS